MTAKCAICRDEPYSNIWQPDLGEDTLTFYRPGYYERGFMIIRIGEQCINRLRANETITFIYKHVLYRANATTLIHIPVESTAVLYPVQTDNRVIAECDNPVASLSKGTSQYTLVIEPDYVKRWQLMNVFTDEEAIRLANIALTGYMVRRRMKEMQEQERSVEQSA